ncbi:ProP effector [Anaerobiospirillum thomasii]|uniref:ProP effector n=1 Tax=Anaerobiospirillum thomasii TaxID=179995 RepID=A0A2X0V7K1_9GAMM|nr:RNA chaperone ProQ [Anaerobiospirillum thomasii]SPT67978.1 ProP effector [Anaerobiospirillum thomasii]SPT70434.1 ProP effector [Anaerobiospirillum thomasii]
METQDIKEKEEVVKTESAVATDKSQAVEGGSRFEHINEALELLYTHFPKCFIKEGNAKPLKIGILDDLKNRIGDIEGMSISKARAAVRLYTTRLRYYYCVKEGEDRIDLDGNAVEKVTAEHASYAKERFDEINAKRKPAPKKNNKKPFNKDDRGGKKPFNRNAGAKRPRPRLVKATVDDLKAGREVLVSTNGRHVKGVVKQDASASSVTVTLDTGATVTLLIERVLIAQK